MRDYYKLHIVFEGDVTKYTRADTYFSLCEAIATAECDIESCGFIKHIIVKDCHDCPVKYVSEHTYTL